MRVGVCVITYQRPEGLERLLNALDKLRFSKSKLTSLKVVVVDNEPTGSACALCERISPSFRWTLECYVEPQRGIPFARNRAVASTGENVDFIAFIDDDEVPEPSWLDELLYVQQLYDADVVQGPVISHFPEQAPVWVTKDVTGRSPFHRTRYPTGYPIQSRAAGGTGNVLIRSQVFKGMTKPFDERLALTGGSDGLFFSGVFRAGYKMVWADDALVYEWVPESRTNIRWVLKREYRKGNATSRYDLKFAPSAPSIRTLIVRIVKAGGWIAQGLLYIPLSLALGQHVLVKALRYICRGGGQLTGIAGVRYEEYRRIHGS